MRFRIVFCSKGMKAIETIQVNVVFRRYSSIRAIVTLFVSIFFFNSLFLMENLFLPNLYLFIIGLTFVILTGFFPICSGFNATVTAY